MTKYTSCIIEYNYSKVNIQEKVDSLMALVNNDVL